MLAYLQEYTRQWDLPVERMELEDEELFCDYEAVQYLMRQEPFDEELDHKGFRLSQTATVLMAQEALRLLDEFVDNLDLAEPRVDTGFISRVKSIFHITVFSVVQLMQKYPVETSCIAEILERVLNMLITAYDDFIENTVLLFISALSRKEDLFTRKNTTFSINTTDQTIIVETPFYASKPDPGYRFMTNSDIVLGSKAMTQAYMMISMYDEDMKRALMSNPLNPW